jgi:oxygen-independent coproporphyrinogen-3 oxidase
VVETLRGAFRFADSDDRDISVELDPRFCNPADMPALAAAGFNRTSLGVQDFDPKVQAAVNRIQSVEETRAIVDACRASAGMRSVNIDLIYGLPGQKPGRLRQDAGHRGGHAPRPAGGLQLCAPAAHLQAADADRRCAAARPRHQAGPAATAVENLTAAGYVYIGMDHFALPDDELAVAQARGGLHRNFMGYTTHADSDLVGLGVSAISHIGGSFSQNPRDLPSWETAHRCRPAAGVPRHAHG